MKKLIFILIQVIFLLQFEAFAICPLPQAITTVATVDNDAGKVTISGNLSTGEGKRLTITIYNSSFDLCDIWQGISGTNGDFTFVHNLKMGDDGLYTYNIKNTNIETITSGSFTVDLSNTVPSVTKPIVEGLPQIRQNITATYKYTHMGNILEGDSDIKWLISDAVDGQYSEISNGNTKVLNILDDYAYKYIKVQVMPITQNGTKGAMSVSDYIYIIAPPFASNVKIRGSAIVGVTLYGEYDYWQSANYEEINSVYKWIKFANNTDTQGTIVGNTASYVPTTADVGAYIAFEVTPKMNNEPNGSAVRSEKALIIAANTTTTSSSGGRKTPSVSLSGDAISKVITNVPKPPTEDDFIAFLDTKGHWAKDDIEYLSEKNIIKGVGEKEFMPEKQITRAEFLALLVRVLELEEVSYKNTFTDVDADSWYAKVIQTAFDNGLALGDGSVFRPNDFITRQEMSVLAVKTLYLKGLQLNQSNKINAYSDNAEISPWASEYISIASGNGIIKGYSDATFRPSFYATRAEATVITRRILDKN